METMRKQPLKRVLLTGFEAFDNEKINPTQELLSSFDTADTRLASQFAIQTLILPVSYQRAWESVRQLLHSEPPYDYIIHFGQAGGRGDISLELGAWNLDVARISDCDGDQPRERPILQTAPLFLPATLPVWALRDYIRQQSIPASLSKDPGGYVCNNLLFKSLFYARENNFHTKIGFIHVPYITSQALEHPNTAFVSFDLLQKMLTAIFDFIAATPASNGNE